MDRFNPHSRIPRLGLVIASGTLVALAGCGKSGEDAPSAATAAVAAAPALECPGAQDALQRPAKFLPTVDGAQVEAAGLSACGIAQDLIARHRKFAESSLDQMCEPLGTGPQRESLISMARRATPDDVRANRQMEMLVKTVAICVDDREGMLQKVTFAPTIYSVGTFKAGDVSCPAYLYEMRLPSSPQGQGYGVRLLGECDAAGPGVEAALNKMNGGDMAARLVEADYSGALPKTYVTPKGETLPFAPGGSARVATVAQPAPEPAGPQIPKSFQGVWELTAEACATAVELGGVTDAGVQILGAEIAEYEEGCTLESVSATGDSAFMGMFTCAAEGEESERSRALHLEGGRLFIDGRPDPYTKCDVEPWKYAEPVILESDETAPAAMPQARATEPEPQPPPALSRDEQMVQNYADELTRSWMTSGTCGQLRQVLFQYAQGPAPANVRVMQMDRLFDKAYDIGCIM